MLEHFFSNSKYTVSQLKCFTASKSSRKIESCFTLAKCVISFLMVLATSRNTLSEVVDEPTTVDAKDLKLRRIFLYIIIIIIMYRIKFSFKWYLCLWFCGCGLLVM